MVNYLVHLLKSAYIDTFWMGKDVVLLSVCMFVSNNFIIQTFS